MSDLTSWIGIRSENMAESYIWFDNTYVLPLHRNLVGIRSHLVFQALHIEAQPSQRMLAVSVHSLDTHQDVVRSNFSAI